MNVTANSSSFQFYGSVVKGENFVGRKEELSFITSRLLEGKSVSIVGLPRIGKTSILYNLLHGNWYKEKLTDCGFDRLVVSISILDCTKSDHVWKRIMKEILHALSNQRDKSLYERCKPKREQLRRTDDTFEKFCILKSLVDQLAEAGVKILLVIDEFDIMRKSDVPQFYLLSILCRKCQLLTSSRRTVEAIEQTAGCKDPYISSQVKNSTLYLSTFTRKDVDRYWERFQLPGNGPEFKLRKHTYRRLVSSYAGSHPHLMNIMNAASFDKIEEWTKANCEEKSRLELQFRKSLENEFDNQLRIIGEVKLAKTLMNLLFGIFETPREKDERLLKRLGFVIEQEEKDTYLCVSEFMTTRIHSLMENENKKLYDLLDISRSDEEIELTETLRETELHLRRLARNVLTDHNINPSDETKWEEHMKSNLSDNKFTKWKTNYDNAVRFRDGQKGFETIEQENDDRCLLDFTTFGNLWYLCFHYNWNMYKGVISDWADFSRDKEGHWENTWFNRYIKPIIDLRNSKDHFHLENVPHSKIVEIMNLCKKIKEIKYKRKKQ